MALAAESGLRLDLDIFDKAEGVRINLWMGIGMLVLGLLFLLWLRLNPPKPPEPAPDDDLPPGH
ncbi:hypothetical protein [Actinoplanes solisilvae]|uniref:hypothetical protein n=1 Tax=Actinoplanes solisilvae TaxID=2486853 RepID=UPI000FD89F9C|nr:hypothetical protein [Actinoplanes solisilvae]